jgi:hypothetical protein
MDQGADRPKPIYIEISPSLQDKVVEYLSLIEEKKKRRIHQIRRVYERGTSFHDRNRTAYLGRQTKWVNASQFNTSDKLKAVLKKGPARVPSPSLSPPNACLNTFFLYRFKNERLARLLAEAGWA